MPNSRQNAPPIDPEQRLRIGEMLVEEGLLTKGQLDEALAMQARGGGRIVENLIALGYLDPRIFAKFLSKQPGMASINLLNYSIPQDIIKLIPPELALRLEVLPIDRLGRDLTVGMACPLDRATLDKLQEVTGLRVKPFLVSMGDIRVALKRYYEPRDEKELSMSADVGSVPRSVAGRTPATATEVPDRVDMIQKAESGLHFEGLVTLVRKIHSLPALPETVMKVREAMNNPDSTMADIAQILSRDPALAAKVISLANSAAYGFPHRVDNIETATRLLGLREIYSVVLSSAVIDYFSKSSHFDYKAFWRRSLIAGTAARIIGRIYGKRTASGLFAAGLLHDIGRAVLAEVAGERYARIDQSLPDAEVIRLENEFIGLAHPEAGYILTDSWDLPPEITEAVRFHHNISQAEIAPDVVAVVSLAALMTDAYGRINRDNVLQFASQCKSALDLLGLTEKQFIGALAETAATIKTEIDAGNEPA